MNLGLLVALENADKQTNIVHILISPFDLVYIAFFALEFTVKIGGFRGFRTLKKIIIILQNLCKTP